MPCLTCWLLLVLAIGSTGTTAPGPNLVQECDSLIQSLVPSNALLADNEDPAERGARSRDEVFEDFLEQVGVHSTAAQREATLRSVELLNEGVSVGQTLDALKKVKNDPLVALVQQRDPQRLVEGLDVVRAEMPKKATKLEMLGRVQHFLREESLLQHGSLNALAALRLAGDVEGEPCPDDAGPLEALHNFATGGCGHVRQALVLFALALPCTCCCLTLMLYCFWAMFWLCTWYWCCFRAPEPEEGVRPPMPEKLGRDPPLFRPAAKDPPPLTVPSREAQTSIPPTAHRAELSAQL